MPKVRSVALLRPCALPVAYVLDVETGKTVQGALGSDWRGCGVVLDVSRVSEALCPGLDLRYPVGRVQPDLYGHAPLMGLRAFVAWYIQHGARVLQGGAV